MIKSFTIYSPKNFLRLLSAWLLLATILASGQTHTLDLTSSGTYTVPQGVTSLTVEAWGGGGGGGGARATGYLFVWNTRSGSGGGGGSYSRKVFAPLASSYNYLIGNGGTSGENADGGDGGTTSFGVARFVNAPGGKGGKRNSGGGGAGGSGAIGDLNSTFNGGSGATGENNISGGGGGSAGGNANGGEGSGIEGGVGGIGGAFTAGAAGANGSTTGTNGTPGVTGSIPGAGGSGGIILAVAGTFNISGGSGAQGLIRLRFTKPSISINPSAITICKGNSVALTASSAGAYSYAWSNGAGTGASVMVSPTNTTTYTVTGTAPNGAGGTFTHTQTITVTVVDPVANIDFTQAPFPTGATACNLQYMKINTNVSVIYTPTTGLYQDAARTIPYTGSSVMEIYAAPNGTQTYTATATNGACSKTNTITITRTPIVPVTVTQTRFPKEASLCELDYTQLTANQSAVFSPVIGLYTNAGLTVAYTGTVVTTVYAAPNGSQSYTATVGSGSCISTNTVTVTRNKKEFIAVTPNADWDTDANWFPAGRPTLNQCVFIPSGKSVGVNSSNANAQASTVTVLNGGGLTIHGNADLTVRGKFTNQSSADDVVIESDGILMQSLNGSNTGLITAKRTVTLSTTVRNQYNYLISPVEGQKMKYIFGTNGAGVPFVQYVLRLNEPTNLFVNDGDGIYVKGKGYSVKEPNLAYTGTQAIFKGVPTNGDFDYPLEYSAPSKGYNLSGNPYPSNLDLYELYQESKNPADNSYYIDSNIYFWDSAANNIFQQQGGSYKGYAYAFFNAAAGSHGTGTAAPGGNGMAATGKVPNYIVKTGQAFMVRAKYSGAKLLFRNAHRISDQDNSVFFGRNGKIQEDDRYWLEYYSPSGVVISNAVVYFDAGNNNFATDDTRIPNSSASDAIFTYAGDEKVIINGRSAFNNQDVLTVGTHHYEAGTYRIKVSKKEGAFKNGQSIYLKDKQLGIITDLTAGDYVFTSEAGEFTNRFEIVYENGLVLSTDTPKNSPINIFRDANDFVVKSSDKMIKNIEIFDASGRMIRTISGKSKELRFESGQFIAGIYILKVALQGGETFTKKIRK